MGGGALGVTEPASIARQVHVLEVSSLEPAAIFSRGSWLEAVLLGYVPTRRWFRSKARRPRRLSLRDALALGIEGDVWLTFVELAFDGGEPETYVLPVGIERAAAPPPHAVVGARDSGDLVWLVDASDDPYVAETLHRWAMDEERHRGGTVKITGIRSKPSPLPAGAAAALSAEQSNTSFRLGTEYADKLVRKLEPGPSLEIELLEHLSRAPVKAPVPELAARVEATFGRGPSATLWVSTRYVENVGDAFTTTVASIVGYCERALGADGPTLPVLPAPFLPRPALDAPPRVQALFGDHLARVELLAARTAELHRALAHDRESPAFRPELPNGTFRGALDASLRALVERTFAKLEAASLPATESKLRARLVPRRGDIERRFRNAYASPTAGPVMRVHGDYHLGQVLDTGTDFVIVDFEGEPARSREERERRRSPLLDVAGMLRSFHYAAHGVLTGELGPTSIDPAVYPALVPWAALHARWSSAVFLSAYFAAMSGTDLLPKESLAVELELHLIEKALYELGYELDFRPRWVRLPLRGLLELLGD